MWVWKVLIRVSTGVQHVQVKARNTQDAKFLIENLYGKGSIQGEPCAVRQIREGE